MKTAKNQVVRLNNLNNKNCKNANKKMKKQLTIANNKHFNIKTTSVLHFFHRIQRLKIELFPFVKIKYNVQNLVSISNYLSLKINSQTAKFRAAKNETFIELIAREAFENLILCNYDIEEFINANYGFYNLQKKEIVQIPYLLLQNMLQYLYKLCLKMQKIEKQIFAGANQKLFFKNANLSYAKVYGIAKYNKNLLNYINISKINIKKCIYCFIEKLNKMDRTISLLLKKINWLLSFTTYHGDLLII